MAFEKLFEPIKIGTMEVKNRYVYAPTNLFYSWQGLVNEEEIAYYTARAMGGTGAIIVGAYLSTKFGVPYMQHPWIFCWDITHIQGLSNLAENIRLAGARAIIQLLPVPASSGQNWTGTQPVGPSAVQHVAQPYDRLRGRRPLFEERVPNSVLPRLIGADVPHSTPREITLDEIQTVIKEHTYGCRLAVWAGFDAIEVHLCHGYLVDEFRHPQMNRRVDRYGGSEENRHRLLLELTEASVRAAREENPNIVMGVRVGGDSPGGYTFEETKRLALQLQELGIDYFHVTHGQGEWYEKMLDYSRELKKILKVPVITPAIHDPKLAEQAITERWTDMVATAHMMIADPEFVNKVKENRLDDIIKCTTCGMCTPNPVNPVVRCLLNPETGREKYNPKYWIKQGFTGANYLPLPLQRKGDK